MGAGVEDGVGDQIVPGVLLSIQGRRQGSLTEGEGSIGLTSLY